MRIYKFLPDGFAHLVGGVQCSMAGNIACGVHAARKDRSGKPRLFKAVHPALDPLLRPRYGIHLLIGSRSQQVNGTEGIVGGEQRVAAVQKGLELPCHTVGVANTSISAF